MTGEDVSFELLPAIDLREGRVVRLLRGDFGVETTYAHDPVAVALGFVAEGARWLHVVDLDGARDPAAGQGSVVRAIVGAVGGGAAVEVAGGLRDLDAVVGAVDAGASRVVVGTAALADPAWVGRAAARVGPDRMAVALDVRAGRAVGHGWRPDDTGVPLEPVLRALSGEGIATFEVTAIERDGTLVGPDLAGLERLVALDLGAIVASGGIASASDIAAVRRIGCAGAIVGRALYEGRLSLADALTAAGRGERGPPPAFVIHSPGGYRGASGSGATAQAARSTLTTAGKTPDEAPTRPRNTASSRPATRCPKRLWARPRPTPADRRSVDGL